MGVYILFKSVLEASSRRLAPGESECERRSPRTLTAPFDLHTRLSADELASTSAQATKRCLEYSADVMGLEHEVLSVCAFLETRPWKWLIMLGLLVIGTTVSLSLTSYSRSSVIPADIPYQDLRFR